MRSLRNICLFCRYSKPSTSPSIIQKRNRHFSKTEPYILPRLVIDLDDADSIFVREAEDLEEGVIESNPQSLKFEALPILYQEKSILERIPSLAKVTPPDLLTYALMGDPDKRKPISYKRIGKRMGSLYARHAIHPSDSVEAKVQILTQNIPKSAGTHSSESNHLAMLRCIKDNPGLDLLQQIASSLCSTKEGCQFLADNGTLLAKSLHSCRKTQYPDVVIFLNNLLHKMNSRGVEVGASLCNVGLYFACETHNLPAAKIYLNILERNSYISDSNTRHALFALFTTLDSSVREESQARYPQFDVTEALRLLTGPWTGYEQQPGKIQSISFASLAQNDTKGHFNYNLYTSYILYLGQLGLTDHLQFEWKSHRMPTILRQSEMAKSILFGTAFLLAKQPDTALAVLQTLSKATDSGNHTTSSSADFAMILKDLVGIVYKWHNVKPSNKLRSLMQMNLCTVPQVPEETFALLDFFLMTDAPRFEKANGGSELEVDYAENDGAACLFVMPKRGSKPLYFKSQSSNPGILKFS